MADVNLPATWEDFQSINVSAPATWGCVQTVAGLRRSRLRMEAGGMFASSGDTGPH